MQSLVQVQRLHIQRGVGDIYIVINFEKALVMVFMYVSYCLLTFQNSGGNHVPDNHETTLLE